MTQSFDCTIQRCPHDKENPYSMINNHLIRDENLSPNCRWLLIYLLSNKEGWAIKTSQIVNHLKSHRGFGRDKVRKLLNEAIEAGYMERTNVPDGNLIRMKYFLSEWPKFKKFFPRPENQGPEDKAPDSQGTNNNQEYSNKKQEEKERPPLFVFKKVKMEKDSYDNLVQEFGEKTVQEMLERLNEYSDINPKRFNQYANHATVIRKWIREEKPTEAKDRNYKIKESLNKLKEKNINLYRNGKIEEAYNRIIFKNGFHYVEINYDDPRFFEKFNKETKNMGIKLD